MRAGRLPAGSHHAHGERRRLQKIPRWHAGPKEHDPRIGRSACRACPVLNRRCPGKHRFVDRWSLAVRCHYALQFVSLRKSPVCVTLQVKSHCAVPVQQLGRARAAATFCPLLSIAASCPGEIGALVIDCVTLNLEARCERLNWLRGVAFGPSYARCAHETSTQHCSRNKTSAGSHSPSPYSQPASDITPGSPSRVKGRSPALASPRSEAPPRKETWPRPGDIDANGPIQETKNDPFGASGRRETSRNRPRPRC